jgi:hypothetical protein
MDAKTAELIVSNNLGPIMKRIRKAVEKNRNSIGETFNYLDEPRLYITEDQKNGLEKLGYRVKFTGYGDDKFEAYEEEVYVEWN